MLSDLSLLHRTYLTGPTDTDLNLLWKQSSPPHTGAGHAAGRMPRTLLNRQ
jgi:hypothetical protein